VPSISAQNPVIPPVQPPVVLVTVPSVQMANTFDASKLPATYGRNALQFDGKPENLAWYLKAVDELIMKCGATDDANKKWIVIHCCEPTTKRDWKAMETANTAFSWDEFKKEIEQVYPEYREVEKGSISGLEKAVLLRAKRPIRANDCRGLQGWIRVYKVIVKQLMEPTARITNREAANGVLRTDRGAGDHGQKFDDDYAT
jgi:hypothetical protein